MGVEISDLTAEPGSRTAVVQRPRRTGLKLGIAALVCLLLGTIAFRYYIRILRAKSILTYGTPKPPALQLYDHFFGYKVSYTETTIPGTAGPISLRIYAPAGETNPPAVVLVHGFVFNGNEDPYMNIVGRRLAEMGFMATLPTLPAETRYEVRSSDLTVIADAARWTAHTSNQQVSILGISFSGGLVIAAAAQPQLKGLVKLVVCISGYNNLETIGRYYVHEPVTDPKGRPYPGNPSGPLVVVSQYLDDLVPQADADAIESAIFNQNRGNITEAEATEGLTPTQKKEFAELHELQSPRIRKLYLASLARHSKEIAAISPSTYLGHMRIPLYILHGTHDSVLPEGEVEWMRQETKGEPDVHILVTPWLSHAVANERVGRWQKFRVVEFVESMLTAASKSRPLAR